MAKDIRQPKTAKPAKAAAAAGGLTITLRRSPIGTPVSHRLVLRSLGLRRLHQTVNRPDTSQVRGAVAKVIYLLDVKSA
ncbi:MAG TPA: 50S ribosomal protein L30 [Nitrospirales bacterium]|nr:50S ribosomal protein L30 [Nitrospirales bacterium]